MGKFFFKIYVLVTHCDSTTDFDSLRQIVTDSK